MPNPSQNYIYIDFENIQEVDISLIADRPVMVVIALGKRQTNLPVGMVKGFLKYPDQVELIEVGVEGKNALDFVLAYHIGRRTLQDPGGYFHILSKDKGFDSLVEHLKTQNISIRRHESFAEILVLKEDRFRKPPVSLAPDSTDEEKPPVIRMVKPPVGTQVVPPTIEAVPPQTPRVVVRATPKLAVATVPGPKVNSAELVTLLTEMFAKNKQNRPARKKSLLPFIHNACGKKLSEAEVQKVFLALIGKGVISLTPQDQIVYKA